MKEKRKTCNRCHIQKPLRDFRKNSSKALGVDGTCKPCKRLMDSNYYNQNNKMILEKLSAKRLSNREIILKAKQNPCQDCGIQYIPFAMDFDHVTGDKIGVISAMSRNAVPQAILIEELSKCELVCSNCHRIRTFNKFFLSPAVV